MKFLFFSLIIFCINPLYGWDAIGHYTIGNIASKHISKSTAAKIETLLDGESIATAAIWADRIRSDSKYVKTYSWHFVNIPKDGEYLTSKKSQDGDIIRAILYCDETLRNKKSTIESKKIALKLLIHFVGDIHQPLHNGYGVDRGGNDVPVKWFGQKSNLHRVWDKHLIELQQLSYTEYTEYLNRFKKGEIEKIQNGTPLDWHQESRTVLSDLYKRERGKSWEFKYSYKNIKIVNNRLKKAGIRLAHFLEQIFANRPYSKKMLKLKNAIAQESLKPLAI